MNQKVSQQTIANKLGISQRAVSKALKGEKDVSPALCQKVKELAERLGYRPNRLARTLREGRSGIIGVLVPRALGYYFMKIWEVIEDRIIAQGYMPLIVRAGYDDETDERVLRMFLDCQVDGMIVVPAFVDWRKKFFRDYMTKGGHVVFIGDTTIRKAFRVFCDDVNGMVDAMAYLRKLGHERIGYVTTSYERNHALKMRLEGLEKGSGKLDFKFVEKCVVDPDRVDGFSAFMERYPSITAVICSADRIALKVCDKCAEMGVDVPGELSVVGFGDNLLHPEHVRIPLTTVAHDPEKIAEIAVQSIFEMIAGESIKGKVAVPNRISVRNSTAQKGAR